MLVNDDMSNEDEMLENELRLLFISAGRSLRDVIADKLPVR